MSNKPSNNDRNDHEVPCRLFPVTQFDMSEDIPPEQPTEIPVAGFVRNEVLHEVVEFDFSQSSEAGDSTTNLQRLIDRLRAGDDSVRWELVERAHKRLRGLAAKILNEDFERLKKMGLTYTTDLTGEIKLRMVKALQKVPVNDVDHFFHLAAQKIRWILLDDAKHLKKPAGNMESETAQFPAVYQRPWEEVAAKVLEFIMKLPENQREVVYRKMWLGWSDNEIEQELKPTGIKVQSLWRGARRSLGRSLKEWSEHPENDQA